MMSKKSYLFIHGQLNAGGAERVLLDILNHFDYSKYDVTLCLIVGGGTLISEVPPSVRIIELWHSYSISYKLAYHFSRWFSFNYFFKRKLDEVDCDSYDVIISFLEGLPLKVHAMIHTHSKQVTWVHSDLLRFPYEANLFRKREELSAYNAMDEIVFVSHNAEEAFVERFKGCKASRKVIYNPIDKDKILTLSKASIPYKKTRFTIVTVGRLTSPKSPERVLHMAQKFKQNRIEAQFVWVGDGELKEKMLSLRKSLRLEDMVEFVGFQKNPYPYIRQADIMFCCSSFEGFSLVVCEAMCLGIPVVSTKTAGTLEVLDGGKYGLVVDQDEDKMFDALITMMSDSNLRDHFRNMGLARAKDFSLNNIITKIEEF
jgi:glycosyltransferase involved in cell wall biosynthesis